MLYSLTGTLVYSDTKSAAVDCGGVAYRCLTTLSTLQGIGPIGGQVTLYTCMMVREDAVELFGFRDKEELRCFEMLTGVSGVGPRVGLSLLSALTPDRLALCIASGDYKSLMSAKGVGTKLAQRIVLELRDKIQNSDALSGAGELLAQRSRPDAGGTAEAISALEALGFSRAEAAEAVCALDPSTPVEEMIKAALKRFSAR